MSNSKFINEIVAKSAYKDELREVFSDHFDDVQQPVSMSLGVYMDGKRIDEIVSMLRKEGIKLTPEELRIAGVRWEMTHSGRSGRTAQQFVAHYLGQLDDYDA